MKNICFENSNKIWIKLTFSHYLKKFGAAFLDSLQSFTDIGGVVGLITGAIINEILTKRLLMITTIVGNMIFLCILAMFG
jgi:hypothetical protein